MMRIAAIAEIHGNILALESVLRAIDAQRPDLLLIGGGFVLDGPEPAAVLDVVRELEEAGAMVVSGLSDIAVADFDLAPLRASFDIDPDSLDAATQWSHEALGPERVDWLRRLPHERRAWADQTLMLWSQGTRAETSPGSNQTTKGSLPLTDAAIICCAMDHVASIKDRDGKLIINVGSAGYSLSGAPVAWWAVLDFTNGAPNVTLHQVDYDHASVARAIETRGLPGDEVRARQILTGRPR